MLFNSYEFVFLYLPVVFAGFFLLGRIDRRSAACWLVASSLFFYGWWKPVFVLLLAGSIAFNYASGYWIARASSDGRARIMLACAVFANLALLAYFKYANFFIETANAIGADFALQNIVLPLGISFFTFTQIAFLVDVSRKVVNERDFIHYVLFVTWFPHLIAGPVLHHKQMMPQFALAKTYVPDAASISVGLTLFTLGLFKKVILADHLALYANPIFEAANGNVEIGFGEAWVGALTYTLQLYFDFSGYSDMALGLSRMFNIKLPLNFNSPYKSGSIIEFWRRWHMTLSAFLRDYLYVPLGGNRKGPVRRHVNLMLTMLLGGLWHGAGWTFVLWGGLHGSYLIINHVWHGLRATGTRGRFESLCGVLLTFFVTVVAWVPFRAADFTATMTLWRGMSGTGNISYFRTLQSDGGGLLARLTVFVGDEGTNALPLEDALMWTALGLVIVWMLPNTQQWLARYHPAWQPVPAAQTRWHWRPNRSIAIATGLLLAFTVLNFRQNSPFLYFQF